MSIKVEAEQKAIECAINMKIQLLEQECSGIKIWTPIESPFENGVVWKESLLGKAYQVIGITLLLPIYTIVMVIDSSIKSVNTLKKKKKLRKQIKEFQRVKLPYETPTQKNIEELWRCYGIDERFGLKQQLQLLNTWLELLYDEKIVKRLDIAKRAAEIGRRESEANARYFEGEKKSMHYSFAPIANTLVRALVDELPVYSRIN